MVLCSAVSKSKTQIERWVKEYLETGHIGSNSTLMVPPIFSYNHLINVTLSIEPDKKITILRQKKIRDKIKDFRKLKMAKNCLMIGEMILLILFLILLSGR